MRSFPTKTIQQILDPVAQQVSQLAIFHEDSEAGRSIPDISAPVQAVCAAVGNLVKVGQDTANASSDEKFKSEMGLALEVVTASSSNLNEAAKLLKDGSTSSDAKDKLITGAKGILSGTSDLLFSYDESEVKKIVRVCENIKNYLPNAAVISGEEDYQTYTKSVQPAIADLLQRVKTRGDDLLIETNRQLLVRSSANVRDNLSSVVSALKAIVQTGQDVEPLTKSRDTFVEHLCEELKEIIRVLLLPFSEEAEMSKDSQRTSLHNDIRTLKDHLYGPKCGKDDYRDKLVNDAASKIEVIAKRFDDDSQKNVSDMRNDLKTQNDELKKCTDANAAETQTVKKAMVDDLNSVDNVLRQQLAKQVTENFAEPTAIVEELQSTAVLEDEEKLQRSVTNFTNLSDSLASTAEDVALFGDNANIELSEEIQDMSKKLRKVAPEVVNAAAATSSNLENESIREFSNGVARQWKDTADSLSQLVDGAIDSRSLITASEEAVEKADCELSKEIEDTNATGVAQKATNLAKHANRVATIAKREIENSEDPAFASTITAEQTKLEKETKNMVTNAIALVTNSANEDAKSKLKKSKETIKSGVHNVKEILAPSVNLKVEKATERMQELEVATHVDTAAQQAVHKAQELVVEEEQEKQESQIPEHLINPIAEAARSLQRETSKWSESDNDIISAARKAAGLMGNMSQCVEDGSDLSRREIIQTAKDIAKISDIIAKHVKEIAEKCSDRRMKQNLKLLLERLPTISTQLKVVATVKATAVASGDERSSKDANEMLVLNATNLMQTIKDTVSAAQAASIKIRTDSGQKMEWRRTTKGKFHY